MKGIIKLDVPGYQIGEEVTVFFKDTMMKMGVCEQDYPGEKDFIENCKFLAFSDEDRIEMIKDLRHEDFFDWLACAVVMQDDFEENPEFYREVICRKLVRIGKLELKGDTYCLPDPEKIQ